ncbi:MAG: SDR family NAD(P)-dependent oxidoreductase [Alphaproteobacteria bacterium]|nr:SDR family NAD(P)-dependent oxidoreductase [Alphaproteobacteria bacterium]
MNAVVVTGASTGIGRGIAEALTRRGFHVFGSVRKESDAERLRSALGDAFTPVLFDVTDEVAVRAGAVRVRELLKGQTLKGLVNNAGIATPGPVLHQPLADYRKQIEVNLVGAFTVTQAFAPLLGADRSLKGEPGRIVNITSLGGKIGSPFLSGYCSAKHGLEGLSESVRRELLMYGIDVVIVGPGAVKTPIWDKAEAMDTSAYAGTDYGPAMKKLSDFMAGGARDGLPVERVGELVHRVLTTSRPKVRYALAPSLFFDWIVPRMLPRRMIDRYFAQRLGLTKA